MRHLIFVSFLLVVSISAYAQGAQKSHTLLMLDFEDRSGVENPLLAAFNDTISFVLSRQADAMQIHLTSTTVRDVLLARAAAAQPEATLVEQGLLAAEWANADVVVMGNYTKQAEKWSLEAQVFLSKAGSSKTHKEIRIQDESLYKMLDDFPAYLLQQLTDVSYVALTTDSWKAYEEFRRGHQDYENYNHFGALEHYEKALILDPTLALAYAEKSNVHATIGQFDQATMAIKEALKWLPKASTMEQFAIRAFAFTWDLERNESRELFDIWDLYEVEYLPSPSAAWEGPLVIAPGGVWDKPLIYQLNAFAAMQEGRRKESDQHNKRWFEAIQPRLQAAPENALLLHQTAIYCAGIRQYVDEAIAMELKAIELNSDAKWREERYILSRLYELKGDVERSLEWAKKHIQHWPDPRSYSEEQMLPLVLEGSSFAIPGQYTYVWDHLAASMYAGKIKPERLLRWCEDILALPKLHMPFLIRTQYLLAEIHQEMNNDTMADAVLSSIGAPRESDWMSIGPLDTSTEAFSDEPPPFTELFADLTATHIGILGKEMKWTPWVDEKPMDGLLNIWGVFNKEYYGKWIGSNFPIPAVVYSCICVKVSSAMDVQVRTGSALMKVWVNDNLKPVVEINTFRAPVSDDHVNNVSLNAGANRFLVAMVSSNSMAFYFRITDVDGNPVSGLEFVSLKGAVLSH